MGAFRCLDHRTFLGLVYCETLGRNRIEQIHWLDLFAAVFGLGARIDKSHAADAPAAIPEVPVKGMVTMLDIGADSCIPCKMMAPIMKELEEEYKGKAAIIFIDVSKNRDQGTKFRDSRHPHPDFL